jgi:hypothetical protein
MSHCDVMGGSKAASVEERGRALNQFVGTISKASGHDYAGTEATEHRAETEKNATS